MVGTDGRDPSKLKVATMSTFEFNQCEQKYKGQIGQLHHTFTCFKGFESGSCTGDGGGPLVCPQIDFDPDIYMQVQYKYIWL